MGYKNLFVDSDVLLDLFLSRTPFVNHAKLMLIECDERNIELSTSTLILANISYILFKKLNNSVVKAIIDEVLSNIHVLPFEADALKFAIDSDFTDFEDAIQYFIAQKKQCDAIITRNIKDYKKSAIPVLTAAQFLNKL